jgi:tRNA G37 N-methylase Trm5
MSKSETQEIVSAVITAMKDLKKKKKKKKKSIHSRLGTAGVPQAGKKARMLADEDLRHVITKHKEGKESRTTSVCPLTGERVTMVCHKNNTTSIYNSQVYLYGGGSVSE